MFRFSAVRLGIVLTVLMTAACAPAQSSPTPAPIVSTIPVLSATAAPTMPTQPPTTSTATPEPTLTSEPTATPPAVPTVLPAPLYFLAPSGATPQIWRIETDGTTRSQITQETAGVTDFDVSAGDGSLAYVSGNALITTDGLGNNRSVLVQGPPLASERDESYYTTEVTRPRWSPDGSRIAYGMNGINLIDAAGGTPTALLPNDPIPGPNDPMTQTANLYWPYNWSPDGQRMLIDIGYYHSEGSLGVFDLTNNSVLSLEQSAGLRRAARQRGQLDSQSIYYANSSPRDDSRREYGAPM